MIARFPCPLAEETLLCIVQQPDRFAHISVGMETVLLGYVDADGGEEGLQELSFALIIRDVEVEARVSHKAQVDVEEFGASRQFGGEAVESFLLLADVCGDVGELFLE